MLSFPKESSNPGRSVKKSNESEPIVKLGTNSDSVESIFKEISRSGNPHNRTVVYLSGHQSQALEPCLLRLICRST